MQSIVKLEFLLKSSFQNTKRFNSTLQAYCKHLTSELEGIKNAGTYKNERIIVTKQGPQIKVAGNNNMILNFCANNYLGLSVSVNTQIAS